MREGQESVALTGVQTHSPGMGPTRDGTCNYLVCGTTLRTTELPGQGSANSMLAQHRVRR